MESIGSVDQDCTDVRRKAPVEWQQVLGVLESSAAQELCFDRFFLFELNQERGEPSFLVLRGESGGASSEALLSVDVSTFVTLHTPCAFHLTPENESVGHELGQIADFLRSRSTASASGATSRSS